MSGYKYNPPSGWAPQKTRADIAGEFRRWNDQAGEEAVSDYDLPLAKTGDIAAEVRFLLRGQSMRVRVDRWGDFGTNLRCCYLNIRDMRLAEARGALESMRETLLQLPAPARERDPYEVLGVRPDAPLAIAEAAYRTLAKDAHPDAGGSADAMRELNAAIEKVRASKA